MKKQTRFVLCKVCPLDVFIYFMIWFEFSCMNFKAWSLWIVIYVEIVGSLTGVLSTINKTNKPSNKTSARTAVE